jgi:hypothetical protein
VVCDRLFLEFIEGGLAARDDTDSRRASSFDRRKIWW